MHGHIMLHMWLHSKQYDPLKRLVHSIMRDIVDRKRTLLECFSNLSSITFFSFICRRAAAGTGKDQGPIEP